MDLVHAEIVELLFCFLLGFRRLRKISEHLGDIGATAVLNGLWVERPMKRSAGINLLVRHCDRIDQLGLLELWRVTALR